MSYWFSKTNYLSSAALEVSSQAAGVVGYPLKEGSGSAAAVTAGEYAGPAGTIYLVEIDSVASGKEIGRATFRWKRADSVGGWEEVNRFTSASVVSLDRGVKIKWMSGSGDDFALGDRWTIETPSPFGPAGLYDLNRDTVFRSGGLDDPTWIKADLGSARQAGACFILDHNFSASATLTLQANSADDWTAPPYEQSLSYGQDRIGLLLDQTYRYWRLVVQDPTNPAGLIEIGEWFLGDGLDSGLLLPGGPARGLDGSELDWLPRQVFSGTFVAPSSTVLSALMEWYEELLTADSRRMCPFLFCTDQENPGSNTYLMRFQGRNLNHGQTGPDSYPVQMSMIEVERTNV